MLYLLIDDTGKVLGAAESDPAWPKRDGREVIAREGWSFAEYAAGDARAVALGPTGELAYDRQAGQLLARQRARTAAEAAQTAEVADRDDLLAQIEAALGGWATATTTQRQATTVPLLRAVKLLAKRQAAIEARTGGR